MLRVGRVRGGEDENSQSSAGGTVGRLLLVKPFNTEKTHWNLLAFESLLFFKRIKIMILISWASLNKVQCLCMCV